VSYAEKLRKWEELEEEAREVRRRSADWAFIETPASSA